MFEGAIEKAKAVLIDKDGNPTPRYLTYIKYLEEWQKKSQDYDNAYANASANPLTFQRWPIVGKVYHQQADEAMNKWIALGFKNEIENAIAILGSQNNDPAIADLITKVQNQKKQ